ncbi:MAG TPA: hypothetical protein EYH43_05565 [Persephonella sp.]|nr:hypothetical protein [Hydrogenothermaceae bacterium]HIQ25432.1 hypothetical protein [Persephonella sp.]
MKNNTKGVILVITLIITTISLALVGAIFYLILTTTTFLAKNKNYIQTLEISKSVSKLIMKKLKDGSIQCKDKNDTVLCSSCKEGCFVDLSYINSSFPEYEITAEIKVKHLTTSDLYVVVVSTKKKNSLEKSETKFLFKKVK